MFGSLAESDNGGVQRKREEWNESLPFLCSKFSRVYFLAYFQILKKYAIVRTKSVRPSVADSTPQGIDRSRSFWAQSIAYDPRT
jgi:hypothetical protein